jgi:NitT/TauT family transport system permease protein
MVWKKALPLAAILSLWLFLSMAKVPSSIYFPDFARVWERFFELLLTWGVYRDLFHTLARTYVAFILAGILGTWTGLWLASRSQWFETLELPIEFLRALPSPVLFPIAVILVGVDDLAKIIIAFYTCFFINLLYAYYGARDVDQAKLDLFRTLKAKKRVVISRLLFWAALPSIFGGLRITLTIALILVIITEMLGGSQYGLGVRIYNSGAPHMVPERYALILILGLTGFVINYLFGLVGRRIIHWQGA